MKFKKLGAKFSKILDKQEKGKSIDPEKVAKLKHKLTEKQQHYENRLNQDLDPEKRKSFEIKLGVVSAHLAKLEELTS